MCKSGRSRQEFSNEYLDVFSIYCVFTWKIGIDTAANEPLKVWITDFTGHNPPIILDIQVFRAVFTVATE